MTFAVLTLLWLATTTLGVSAIVVLDSIRARHHRPGRPSSSVGPRPGSVATPRDRGLPKQPEVFHRYQANGAARNPSTA